MVFKILNNEFLDSLPPQERIWTEEQISRIKRTAKTKIQALQGVVSIFGEKSYGLQEAILQGIPHRYPSEVENQRFCAEEALKNYILAESLGFKGIYLRTQNFRGRGLPHDVVIIPHRNHFLMLDWQSIEPITLHDKTMRNRKTGEVITENIHQIEGNERLEEVKRFHQPRSLVDLLQTPQLIVRHEESQYTTDVYVQARREALEFIYFTTDMALEIPSYYRRRLQGIMIEEEWGIIRQNGSTKNEEVPYAYQNGKHGISLPWIQERTDEERSSLIGGMLYQLKRKKRNARLVTSKKERSELARLIASNPETTQHREFYKALVMDYGSREAEKYLDVLAHKLKLEKKYGENMVDAWRSQTNSTLHHFERVYDAYQCAHLAQLKEKTRMKETEETILKMMA